LVCVYLTKLFTKLPPFSAWLPEILPNISHPP
jgi:hypothetical protein